MTVDFIEVLAIVKGSTEVLEVEAATVEVGEAGDELEGGGPGLGVKGAEEGEVQEGEGVEGG